MKNNGKPEPTEYVLIGGTVYLKIPPYRLQHLGIKHIKDDGHPNRLPAKILAQENEKDEHYISNWYPDAESQKKDSDNQ